MNSTGRPMVKKPACRSWQPPDPKCKSHFLQNQGHLHRFADCKTCEVKASTLLQELQRLASQYALPADAQHDVAANASVPAYTLFPHADLQGTSGIQCLVSSSDETTTDAVISCTRSKSGTCCVEYDRLQLSLDSTAVVRHAAMNVVCPQLQASIISLYQTLNSTIQLHSEIPY